MRHHKGAVVAQREFLGDGGSRVEDDHRGARAHHLDDADRIKSQPERCDAHEKDDGAIDF